MENFFETMKTWLMSYSPNALAALVIFFAGWMVAKVLTKTVRRLLHRAHMDETLSVFLSRLAHALFLAFVVVAAIQKLGVDTTSFVAIVAAAGLAIGFALQGSLSNFAAGVMIIALRPFKVGDFIEAGGIVGAVEAVSIFATELKTPDNKKIIVPNSAITSGNITNYSAEEIRRIDLVVGIGYGDDIRIAKALLQSILSEDERVLADPASTVAVAELGESSVNLVVRPWVSSENYWPVKFDLTEKIKLRLDEEGLNIPFPQRDVHIYNVGEQKTA